MKYKTLFRILLKVIGVWVIVSAIGEMLSQAGYTFYTLVAQRIGSEAWIFAWGFAAHLIQIGIGLYLFFGGKWIADKAIPGNRPYCHECGYDLTNAVGNVCTECGTPFRPAVEVSSSAR